MSHIERINFSVDGDSVVGNLHVPEGAGPFPGVIVGGPMTSVKEQVTGVYAKALAERVLQRSRWIIETSAKAVVRPGSTKITI